MSWRLMELLPKLLDRTEFQPLQRYLQDDEDDSKRFQLAEKLPIFLMVTWCIAPIGF